VRKVLLWRSVLYSAGTVIRNSQAWRNCDYTEFRYVFAAFVGGRETEVCCEAGMGDITNPRLLILKGGLFLAVGVLAAALILVLHPEVRSALLLAVAVWAFCRAYYLAFYVIERYIDPEYRFAGLCSALVYLWRRRHQLPRSK
jgi:hypothetical protein